MAPSNVQFPLSPFGKIIAYNYTVDYSPVKGVDVLDEFIKSCEKRQIKTGFYYTVVTNNWLNVESGFVSDYYQLSFIDSSVLDIQVQNRTLKSGQLNIIQETYDAIVLQQLREIWTRYGTLNEIWFDGGLV